MRFLIVEDDFTSRRLMQKLLSPYGESDIAVNGIEAVTAFKAAVAEKEPYALICLDVMMPEMDGFAVLDALKVNAQTAQIPVIVVTAKELTAAEKERLRGRIHALMQKGSFMNDDLVDEVRALIR